MLVLTRQPSESIIIGKDLITIKVLDISGQSVRLGIEAPKELSIHREEIYDQIKKGEPQKPKKESVVRTISQSNIDGENF